MEQNVSTEKKSSEVIVVTSGKGGVGKTTTSANVGTGLAKAGSKVCLIDTDIGHGTGEPYRLQSGRCGRRELQNQTGTDPGQETSGTVSDAVGTDQR